MTPINVLSLFNGMSCGMIALEQLGIPVANYFSSEIDKYANIVSQANYPQIIQLGDVKNVFAKDLPPIDLILSGFPCQSHSFAGKGKGFDDPRGQLFFEFVRILEECRSVNPGVIFLGENVIMKKQSEYLISKSLGIGPIQINAALVSAQSRNRNYWTNIYSRPSGLFAEMCCAIPQPKDRGILLKDILQPPDEIDEKYYLSEKAIARLFRRNYSQSPINPEKSGTLGTRPNSAKLCLDSGTTPITESCGVLKIDIHGNVKKNQDKAGCLSGGAHSGGNHSDMDLIIQVNPGTESGGKQPYQQNRVYDPNGKMCALSAVSHGNAAELTKIVQWQTGKSPGFERTKEDDKSYCIDTQNNLAICSEMRIRRLTEIECERLQGVPHNYTNHVSSSQRYKMLGNGWQIEVIKHILLYYGK